MEAFKGHWKSGEAIGFQSPRPAFTETALLSPPLYLGVSLRVYLKISF